MTLDEFLAALRETPREWYLTPNAKMIRRRIAVRSGDRLVETECCPVSGCGDHPRSVTGFLDVANELGLPYAEAMRVAATADNDVTKRRFDPTLRARLLEACGLKESGA